MVYHAFTPCCFAAAAYLSHTTEDIASPLAITLLCPTGANTMPLPQPV